MASLFDLTLTLAAIVGRTANGLGASGSTTTIVDTTLEDVPDDFWKGGTLWWLTGANAGSTAIITDWVQSTHTLTFAAQASGVMAGASFMLANIRTPRATLRAAINHALASMRYLATDSSLASVTNQVVYTLPAGVAEVRRVELVDVTATPNTAEINQFWREAGGSLIFDAAGAPDGGLQLKLYYPAIPAALAADNSAAPGQLRTDLIVWRAAQFMLDNMLRTQPELKPMFDLASARVNELKAGVPALMATDPHLAGG